jgi:uncharacterized protein (DUF305 family)
MRVGKSPLALCAVVVLLAGCGDSDKRSSTAGQADETPDVSVVQPGAPGEPSREVVPTATPMGDGFKPADVEFMQGMIHHHQQAVTMSDWVPDRSQSTSIRLMARRIAVSQQDEMKLMRDWLKKRGVDPSDHSHRHRKMPGMVNSRQLSKLKDARGREFDRLFLRYMTQHHQGALTMVQELYEKGGGNEVEIGQFVLHVDADQSIEIERMQQLAKGL